MLKLRLSPTGRIKDPSYRLVVIEHSVRRNGKPVEYVGYYDPLTKQSYFNVEKIQKWLNFGAKPTTTVFNLLKKSKIIKT